MTYKHKGRTYLLVEGNYCSQCAFSLRANDCPRFVTDDLQCSSDDDGVILIWRETLMSRFRNWLKNRGRG